MNSISKVSEISHNTYFRVGSVLVLMVAVMHYLSSGLSSVHLLAVFLGLIPITFYAIHLGRNVSLLLGILLGALLMTDVVVLSTHPETIEIVVEITMLLGFMVLALVVGGWADLRNESRPRLELGTLYWSSVAQTSMGQYITQEEVSFINRAIAGLPEKPVIILDAGAGSGKLEPLLTTLASHVICTEINPELTGILAHTGSNVMPVLVKPTIRSLPLADDSVDVVVCLELPELAEQNWFYAECQRVLKHRGIMIIMSTNRFSWKGALKGLWSGDRARADKRYYLRTIHDVRRSVKRYGLTVRRVSGMNWAPFSRASDSPLVPLFMTFEKLMKLSRLVFCSPWVLLEVRKE
jgi:SAM-dependent methyltransferase